MFKFFRARKPSSKDALELKESKQEVLENKITESKENNEVEVVETIDESNFETSKKRGSKLPKPEVKETKKEERIDFNKVSENLFSNDALEISKRAAAITAGGLKYVGSFVNSQIIDLTTVEHSFSSNLKAYPDWEWKVSLTESEGNLSILEVALKPTENSLKAPVWVTFLERLKRGDVLETDELPYEENDSRLIKNDQFNELSFEDKMYFENLAIERNRVLNAYGKADLAARWYEGSSGPETASTRISKEPCQTCAFYVPLSGDLGQLFGVCANSWSRDDARVVSSDHGCGMHSETDSKPTKRWNPSEVVVDSVADVDLIDVTKQLHPENLQEIDD